jgi:hypothetical protein
MEVHSKGRCDRPATVEAAAKDLFSRAFAAEGIFGSPKTPIRKGSPDEISCGLRGALLVYRHEPHAI